jgi:CheY-like chemotaxis protein
MEDALKAVALVVEDDQSERAMVSMLLEETDIQVIQCESAEAAELVLEKVGGCLCMMFTDVNLAGIMTGAELATKARQRFPGLKPLGKIHQFYPRERSSCLSRGGLWMWFGKPNYHAIRSVPRFGDTHLKR